MTDSSQAHLLRLGILEPVMTPDEAELFVLSTRMRRSEVSTAKALAKGRQRPVVVLTHTGGERTAWK